MDFSTNEKAMRNFMWLQIASAIIAILFGILSLVRPVASLLFIVYIVGAYVILAGIIGIAFAFEERKIYPRWWLTLLMGIVGVIVGLMVFFWPNETALILLFLVAAWAIITGIGEMAVAFMSSEPNSMSWLVGIMGALTFLLGLFLVIRPGAGILSIIWLIGIYAIVYGVLKLVRVFMLRSAIKSTMPA